MKNKHNQHLAAYQFSCLAVCFFLVAFAACSKHKEALNPVQETSSMTDRDGNVYGTIKIGNQWWMSSSLQVRTYQNGDSVQVRDSQTLWQDTVAGCCYVSPGAISSTGLLYNSYAANDVRQLIPAGWHIPSDAEWQTLEMHLGMSADETSKVSWRGSNEGDKLKRMKSTQQPLGAWYDSDNVYQIWPNNESGFSALAGSCRMFNGAWGNPGLAKMGFWWSSTAHGQDVWYRYLDYNKSKIFRFYGDKRYGFSIRCVKD
jgi:uncharacterized protein (TIGR02145 family)